MIINPIINLWIMIPISLFLVLVIIAYSKGIKIVLRLIFLLLLFIINLRIMIYNGKTTVYSNNMDIIFIIDSTISMNAEDVEPTRLDQVKKDIDYIINKTIGSSYAVITYGSVKNESVDTGSYLRVPFTKDSNMVSSSVNAIEVSKEYNARGSQVTLFKSTLEQVLESEKNKDGHKVIVYLFTDGENTNGKQEYDLSDLKDDIDGGAVLGYGTKTGGKMKVYGYGDDGKYLTYYDNYYEQIAISKIDEDRLQEIAHQLGVSYIHVNKSTDIAQNISEAKLTKIKTKTSIKKSYNDTYYYLTPFIGLLLLIELYNFRKVKL